MNTRIWRKFDKRYLDYLLSFWSNVLWTKEIKEELSGKRAVCLICNRTAIKAKGIKVVVNMVVSWGLDTELIQLL